CEGGEPEGDVMKKLLAFVGVVMCCVAISGCPTTTTGPAKDKKDVKDTKGKGEAKSLSIKTDEESYTLKQGEPHDVKVTITRNGGWDDPVSITIEDLPKGVKAQADTKLDKGVTEAKVTLTAADDAEVVENHGSTVKGKGGDHPADHPIKITIKKKG